MAYLPEPEDNEPETSILSVSCAVALLIGIGLIVLIIEAFRRF